MYGIITAVITKYLSTFTTGFSDLVATTLQQQLKDVTLELVQDGVIVYTTTASVNQIRQVRYLNNSFILLKHHTRHSADPLRTIMTAALSQHIETLWAALPRRATTFRVRTFRENQPVAVDTALLHQLEQHLSRSPLLHLNRRQAKLEFWCFTRAEGDSFFAARITRTENYEKTLPKGALRPELAHLLCLLAQPKAKHIFLDPMAGYGSIPAERAQIMPATKLIAGEHDPALVTQLTTRFQTMRRPITTTHLDVLKLPYSAHTIDEIVTDPPWGFYEKTLDLPAFYTGMLDECIRVLRPNGRLVILTAQKELLERLIQRTALHTLSVNNTLVSGKKAAVYTLTLA